MKLRYIAAALVLIPAWAGITYAIVSTATMTGPNCPGMDPSYIGWCQPQP